MSDSYVEADRGTQKEDGIRFVDYVLLVWRYKWLVFGICVISSLTTFVVTLRMPKVYVSATTLLTPREGGGGNLLSGLASAGVLQQIPGLSVPSLTPNRDVIISILKSRTVAEAIASEFQLQERYHAKFLHDAIDQLQAGTSVSLSKEGVIAVEVSETDAMLAARIANAYIDHLDLLVTRFGSGEAGRQKVFIGEQLARSQRDLAVAEDSLRRFQERNRAIVLQEQTRGAIDAAARLKGEMMAAEVQLQVMRNFATDTNPEVVSLKGRIEEMRRQLAQMQYGDESVSRNRGGRQEIYVPFAKVPGVSLELARQTRDVKVQETLVTLLAQQFEQAKIAEARDMPLVQVLDRAVPAVRHSRPSKRLNVAIAGVLSLAFSLFLIFILEYSRNVRLQRRHRTPV